MKAAIVNKLGEMPHTGTFQEPQALENEVISDITISRPTPALRP